MPSMWRYFCCICDKADDKRSYSAHYELNSRRRNKRRTKSGKNTWARRSLLDNEDIELNEIPVEQRDYQMRAIPTPTNNNERMSEDSLQRRLFDHFTPKKRMTVHGVFENSHDESFASRTTLPWMDERFVPNTRNGTRLGISSIQINAKRNGEVVSRNNANQNTKIDIVRPHAFIPYAKSQSFTEGQTNENIRTHTPHVINSAYVAANARHVHNGHVLRSNLSSTKADSANLKRPLSLGVSGNYRDKPMVLKAPTSDVGVRRVSTKQVQTRQDRIPKLEEFKPSPSAPSQNNFGDGHTRPSIMDIFPSSDITNAGNENESDVSYASEIIFRKKPQEQSENHVSLKRSDRPGMFSANTKYERLKPERSKSEKSKPERPKSKGNYSNLSSESMYGYVPKVVQNVRASNALEGTKIDDFFMQRMHERQLENFGSLDESNDNDDNEPIIITSLVDSTEDLSITDKSGNETNISETLNTSRVSSSVSKFSGNFSDKNLNKCKQTHSANSENTSLDRKVLTTEQNKEHKTTDSNRETDKVIMINFPPNPANDKKIPIINNLKTSSHNESHSEVSSKSTKIAQSKGVTPTEVLY